MRCVLVLALATGAIVVSACSGDDTSDDNHEPSAGASGAEAGGSSSGGSASKAGESSGGGDGGDAGSAMAGAPTMGGTSATAGAGGAADAGMAGAGGNHAGAGGNDAGGAGMGGAGAGGEPALVYACGSATLIQKKCSAFFAANCTVDGNPDNTLVCADCVDQATSDREGFQTDPPCDTCNAKWDAIDQCEVDAFESGNLAFGVACFDGYADGTDSCYATLNDAIECQSYVGDDQNPMACPATWPPQ
jgi:hypothetical protein